MIRVDVKDLKGDEILAVPVMSASDTVLVQSDTELKEEYIQKLTDQRIGYVYVKEQTGSGQIVKERKEEKEPQQKKIYRLDEITAGTEQAGTQREKPQEKRGRRAAHV